MVIQWQVILLSNVTCYFFGPILTHNFTILNHRATCIEEEERKLNFNKQLHFISDILKYIIRLAIEGKQKDKICLYTIFPCQIK